MGAPAGAIDAVSDDGDRQDISRFGAASLVRALIPDNAGIEALSGVSTG